MGQRRLHPRVTLSTTPPNPVNYQGEIGGSQAGDFQLDTTNKALYVCTATTASTNTSTWTRPDQSFSYTFHLWLDPTSGDDANDGYTTTTAKKTWNNLIAQYQNWKIMPGVTVMVHLKSDLTNTACTEWTLRGPGRLVITGPETYTVVDSKNQTRTGSAVGYIEDSAATFGTNNEYVGYLTQISGGAYNGFCFAIQAHTNTRLYFSRDAPNIAAASTFTVMRPTVTVSGSGTVTAFPNVRLEGNASLTIQNLYYSGSTARFIAITNGTQGQVALCRCVVANTNGYFHNSNFYFAGDQYYNINNAVLYTDRSCSAGFLVGNLNIEGASFANLSALVTKGSVKFFGPTHLTCLGGLRVIGAVYSNSGFIIKDTTSDFYPNIIGNTGYNQPEIDGGIYILGGRLHMDGGAKGILIKNSSGAGIYGEATQLSLKNGVEVTACSTSGLSLDRSVFAILADSSAPNIHDNTDHGIKLVQSRSRIENATSGTGNGKLGIYITDGSSLRFNSAAAPTITGTTGNIGVQSETVESVTWAAIAADADKSFTHAGRLTAIRGY